jgi:hypothetical protein
MNGNDDPRDPRELTPYETYKMNQDFGDIENNIAQLVPTKSDFEIAKEFREKVIEAYQPLLKILSDMDKHKFNIQVNVGKNGLGKFDILSLAVIKIYQEF